MNQRRTEPSVGHVNGAIPPIKNMPSSAQLELIQPIRQPPFRKGSDPVPLVIPTSCLFVDHTYQRGLENSTLKKMKKAGWQPHSCQALSVSDRGNGTYAVMDGGHRLEIAKHFGIPALNCTVSYGLSVAEESAEFVRMNKDRRAPSAANVLKGKLAAGDPDTLQLEAIAQKHGFRLEHYKGDNIVCAAAALQKAQQQYGVEALEQAFGLLRTVWDGDQKSLIGHIVEGTTRFMGKLKPSGVVIAGLVERLKSVPPSALLRDAKRIMGERDSAMNESVTEALAEIYNKRRNAENRLDLGMLRDNRQWVTRRKNEEGESDANKTNTL